MAGNQLLPEWQQPYNGGFQKQFDPFLLVRLNFHFVMLILYDIYSKSVEREGPSKHSMHLLGIKTIDKAQLDAPGFNSVSLC
jgi:hypothetical protein